MTKRQARALCWRSGQIEVRDGLGRDPYGAIRVATGPLEALDDVIGATARLAYDNKTLLVPGVPEAEDDDAAATALERYAAWIRSRLEAHGCQLTIAVTEAAHG